MDETRGDSGRVAKYKLAADAALCWGRVRMQWRGPYVPVGEVSSAAAPASAGDDAGDKTSLSSGLSTIALASAVSSK